MTRPAILDIHASAYGRAWRMARAALVAASRLGLPALLVLVVVATDPPVTPPVLRRLVTVVALVPALAAWAVRRALATEVEVRSDGLLVQRRDRRLEIPLAAIADVTPWTVPLPGPGLSFRMRSGRRLTWGIEAADPTPLVHALDDAGVAGARAASAHPVVVYARARAGISRPLLDHPLVKFALFPLAPAAILFYTHQHIAYGAFLGEYYLLGPGAYLADAVEHWTTVAIYLLLYASVLRGVAEGVALGAAPVAPTRTAGVRRAVEVACRVLYYGGVPVLLLLRYGVIAA